MKPLVYVAGPYSHPDPVTNTQKAVKVGQRMLDDNLVTPIIPHLTMLWHIMNPQEIEYWYHYDLDVLAHCNVLYRIPGKSTGADNEVAFAKDNGIPVWHPFYEDYDRDLPNFYHWAKVVVL